LSFWNVFKVKFIFHIRIVEYSKTNFLL